MKTKIFTICAAIILFAVSSMANTWTTLDMPGAVDGTFLYGISGNTIVGTADGHGIVYNMTTQTWTTLDMPGAQVTYVTGVSGSTFVGYYETTWNNYHSFLYDGTTWVTLDKPGASYTFIHGISGNNIVGSADNQGFLYNMTTQNWANINTLETQNVNVTDIDGSNIVGIWNSNYRSYTGFLYDGTNWTTFSPPATVGRNLEWVAISGNYIVTTSRGQNFLYNIASQSWTGIDIDVPPRARIYGINGNNVVGFYTDLSGQHGFIATIPEPATILLLAFSGLFLKKKNTKRK